jgi:hypothetical protein
MAHTPFATGPAAAFVAAGRLHLLLDLQLPPARLADALVAAAVVVGGRAAVVC